MSAPEPLVVAALVVMAAVTLLMRVGGFWLMGRVPLTPRVRRMLEALPGSIIAALVLPLAVRIGPVAFLAVGAAAAMMAWRRNELLAVAAGVAAAIAARAAGLQ
jgi:branched chain amino acid efflux pump